MKCFFFQKYQQSGFPVTDLHEFLKDHSSAGYRKDRTSFPFICCCRRSVECFKWVFSWEVQESASHCKMLLDKCWSIQDSACVIFGCCCSSCTLLHVRSLVSWWCKDSSSELKHALTAILLWKPLCRSWWEDSGVQHETTKGSGATQVFASSCF